MAGNYRKRKSRGIVPHEGINRRIHPCDRRRRPEGFEADTTPFSAYASAWLERKRATLAPSTYGDYRSILNRRRTMYQTRHTFASLMLSHGEDPLWVARMMGHTGLDMIFRHYGRFIRNRSRKDGVLFLEGYQAATTCPPQGARHRV